MSALPTSESERAVHGPNTVERLGAWLFKQRTWLPLPIALTLLLLPAAQASSSLLVLGAVLVTGGELLRLWAVRHIGVISRTRSHRTGPLVSSGPFGHVRNPLYLGNALLWVGFAISSGLVWLAPLILLLLGAGYHAIVRWEEGLLETRLGEHYRAYTRQVPRWIPALGTAAAPTADERPSLCFSWPKTLFSERGTLIAIAGGCLLLWIKSLLTARS